MNTNTWTPRWYYIMQNNTSGKLYVGQSSKINMDNYKGSGGYWKLHCKKHGGYSRKNISLCFQEWFVSEEKAQSWLNSLPKEYWKSKEYANLVEETTALCSVKGYRFSEEAKNKMSLAKIGFKHSEETKLKMSLGRQKEKHPMWGKIGPMRGKLGPLHPRYGKPGPMLGKEGPKAGANGMAKAIRIINVITQDKIIFDSLTSAANYLGLKKAQQISKVFNGKHKFIAKRTLGETYVAEYI